MGLLDDAIREHLDLKRRRGADPTEVERAEREALGPVRRGPGTAEQADPDAEREMGANGGLVSDEADGPEWLEHDENWVQADDQTRVLRADQVEESHAAFAERHDLVDEPVAAQQPVERARRDEEPDLDKRPEPDAEPTGSSAAIPTPHPAEAPAPERRPRPASPQPDESSAPDEGHHGDQTAEYDVERQHHEERERQAEHEPREPTPKKGEDVLEETPEFLQDTPDHDRLWFEQRPPRDFDFDK
jgi:hypothetical protein